MSGLVMGCEVGQACRMRLQQNQIWKKGAEYIRITRLERFEVAYKTMADLSTKEGSHHVLPKKEFCRLLHGAKIFEPETPLEEDV